jgi:hypothetical protein
MVAEQLTEALGWMATPDILFATEIVRMGKPSFGVLGYGH